LVVQEGTMTPSAQNALERLSRDEMGRKTVKQWPGTTLLGTRSATLIEYRCTDTLANGLLSLTDRLYGWLRPDLPEDLGFIRADGSVWMAATSHERFAFLDLSSDELTSLTLREADVAEILSQEDVESDDEP